MRPTNKKLLAITLSSIGLITLITSNFSHADIYKWRNAQGIIQYSDTPPVGAEKVSRAEIINALQPKALCADPAAAKNTTTAKLEANFFGFNSPNRNLTGGFMGQPASSGANTGLGSIIGFGRNTAASPTRSVPVATRNNPVNNIPGLFGAAPRNTAASPATRPPSFVGLNPTSFFNVGNRPVTVFGRPFNLGAISQPAKPITTTPKPTPIPVAQTATPIPTPAPTTTPASNIVQVGLMPAVDISKNMVPVIGASEPFIGANGPPAPGDGDGQFRTICRPSHMSNDDPIIYPNQQGATHLHTFFGNTSLNYKSDVSNMRNVGNSTCKGGSANRSAYWVPSMIDTATKAPLIPNDAVFYYKTGYTVKRELVTPPPKGLRIIAGNSKSTVSQRIDKYTNHVRYNCVLPGNKVQPVSDSIPACPNGAEVHSVIHFPNCWDSKNLDSPDHQSHMAYAKYGVGCPATHPTAIPSITYNIFYKVTQAAGTANWRLASDNYAKSGYNAGYSGHADWVNGWDENIMKMAVENCDNKGLDCGVGNLGNGTGLWFKKNSEY